MHPKTLIGWVNRVLGCAIRQQLPLELLQPLLLGYEEVLQMLAMNFVVIEMVMCLHFVSTGLEVVASVLSVLTLDL